MASLNGSDLYNLATASDGPLAGTKIDQTVFYQYLVMVQGIIEGMRDWMVLRALDTSLTALAANKFSVSYNIGNLAKPFNRFLDEEPLLLIDPNNTQDWIEYAEVPYQDLYRNQNDVAKFAVDYAQNKLYLLGTIDKNRTIQLNYIFDNADITAGTAWAGFPQKFHPILAFSIAALYKGGVDFDDQNARQVVYNDKIIEEILSRMIQWDANLQVNSLKGRDRSKPGDRPWYGGRVGGNPYS